MSVCDAINANFKKRIFPIPDGLRPLPDLVPSGTLCLLVEPLGYPSGARVGDVCVWIGAPDDTLPVCAIGVGHYCVDKGCMMLAPESST